MKIFLIVVCIFWGINPARALENEDILEKYVRFFNNLNVNVKTDTIKIVQEKYSAEYHTTVMRLNDGAGNSAVFNASTGELLEFERKLESALTKTSETAAKNIAESFFEKFRDFVCKEDDYTKISCFPKNENWEIKWFRQYYRNDYNPDSNVDKIILVLNAEGKFISYHKFLRSGSCRESNMIISKKEAESIADDYQKKYISSDSFPYLPQFKTELKVVTPNFFSRYYLADYSCLVYEVLFNCDSIFGMKSAALWIDIETGNVLGGIIKN